MSEPIRLHEPGCTCGYVNPVTEWAGGSYVSIVAYECPQCHRRTSVKDMEALRQAQQIVNSNYGRVQGWHG
jgi:hypothetical protein